MTTNRFRTALFATCTALTIAGGIAYAGAEADGKDSGSRYSHEHRQMHRHGGTPLMGTLKQLDLTAEQQQSIKATFQNNAQQRQALRDRQRDNRAALATTMPDDPGYAALIAARKQLAVDAIQQSSDTQTQIYALLTPEQKAHIPQLLAEKKARWEQRRLQRNKTTQAS